MQQTSALLDRDPTIYAVSAYNAQAFSHTAHNTSRLYRDDSFPAYGWMVKKAYIEEILPMWPAAYSVNICITNIEFHVYCARQVFISVNYVC